MKTDDKPQFDGRCLTAFDHRRKVWELKLEQQTSIAV